MGIIIGMFLLYFGSHIWLEYGNLSYHKVHDGYWHIGVSQYLQVVIIVLSWYPIHGFLLSTLVILLAPKNPSYIMLFFLKYMPNLI